MKYIQGKTLKEILVELTRGNKDTHERFRFPQRAQIIKELLRVLISSHEKGIIHRDIKPANIMVSEHGEIYLMDWGIAMDINISNKQQHICGTPLYMAPEILHYQKYNEKSDLWSVGIIIYEMIAIYIFIFFID